MLDGPQVFVDIDTQRDFLEPAGALYVAGSDEIITNLARLTRFAQRHHIPVLATACAHAAADPELKRFPPHCMAGTAGAQRVAATAIPQSVVLTVDDRLAGDLPPHLTLEKCELDVFSRVDADDLVARYRHSAPTFVVYGVATDYCVCAAVLGLLRLNCRVAIVTDAVRAIDATVEAGLLTEFAKAGVVLTVTDVVCREPTSGVNPGGCTG
jgi:nicotinamidase/pyrazinamidase